jgi:5-hydroxyisourate hydrolase-like protein (transthyretin family)
MARPVPSRVDEQGNFQMRGVAAGSYVLSANYMEGNKLYSARSPVEVGNSNVEGIELELRPPADIEGRVVVEGSNDAIATNLTVFLQPKTIAPMTGGSNAVVKGDRTFKLTNIAAGEYDVNLSGLPGGFYLRAVRLGEQDVTDSGLDFSDGVPAAQLTVVINPNAGQVEGSVQNSKGDPAAGVTVTLIPDTAHRQFTWMYKTANTDQNGHFTIKGVRPGEYRAYAWEELEPGAQQDPDFVKLHETAGESVTVKEGSHESVELKAVPAERTADQQAAR